MTTRTHGTQSAPIYYDGPSHVGDDVRLRARFFTYKNNAGLVAGAETNVTFTINATSAQVWPFMADWNTWQNEFNHYYSGVLAELEGKTFALSTKPNDTERPHFYTVEKVIPEYLIVISQPILTDEQAEVYGLPGTGGACAGYHVAMLHEQAGATTASILMDHASVMSKDPDAITDEEALAPWREKSMVPEWIRKWRDDFIPKLKSLVASGGR